MKDKDKEVARSKHEVKQAKLDNEHDKQTALAMKSEVARLEEEWADLLREKEIFFQVQDGEQLALVKWMENLKEYPQCKQLEALKGAFKVQCRIKDRLI